MRKSDLPRGRYGFRCWLAQGEREVARRRCVGNLPKVSHHTAQLAYPGRARPRQHHPRVYATEGATVGEDAEGGIGKRGTRGCHAAPTLGGGGKSTPR